MNAVVKCAIALAACVAAVGPVQATSALQFTKVGLNAGMIGTPAAQFTLRFNNVSDPGNQRDIYSNISAQVRYELLDVDYVTVGNNIRSDWKLKATITNTSEATTATNPLTSARISSFGFSTASAGAAGNNPAFIPLSSAAVTNPGVYERLNFNNNGLNIPNVAGSNDPQLCFRDGNRSGCSGNGGVNMGASATSTEFVLSFAGPAQRTALTLHNFFLRFQDLDGTGVGAHGNDRFHDGSGVGIVSDIEIVPEPASWAMLIAGFGLVGATLRRRRALLAA